MLLRLSAIRLLLFCHHLTGRGHNRLLTGQGNACCTHHSGHVFYLVHFPGDTLGKYLFFKTGIALVNTPEYLGPDHVFVCDIPLPLLGTVVSSISSHYCQF